LAQLPNAVDGNLQAWTLFEVEAGDRGAGFRKGLTYYLSAKAILLSIFIVPLALGVPFPFAPIHIILTELLMDLASSTIFVTEVAEPDPAVGRTAIGATYSPGIPRSASR
jgi:hypothetical protein